MKEARIDRQASLDPEEKWFIEGSSFVVNGEEMAKYAVMSQK
jgi:hypothetical protein